MRVKATLMWCGARSLLATPVPQVECRRAPTLTSTSATAQVARRLADKATSCKAAEPRRQRPRHRQVRHRLLRLLRHSDCSGYGYTYSDSYGYTDRNSFGNADGDAKLHTGLVRGAAPPNPGRARGWRLFPGQWKVLYHGRPRLRHSWQRVHAPI